MVRAKLPVEPAVSNAVIADQLQEIAGLRELSGASPYRVAAYRNAVVSIRRMERPLAELYAVEGQAGLRALPGIGVSLARRIADIVRHGHSRVLERLRGQQISGELLESLPTVGPRLAARLRETLHVGSLQEVYAAAASGSLRRVPGFGRKRVDAIREALAARLKVPPPQSAVLRAWQLSVKDLLGIDRLYRRSAEQGRLMLVAPRRDNPQRRAWLAVMKLELRGVKLTAHFATTARSRELGKDRDWVVIYSDDKQHAGRWTLVTAATGPLAGKRVVRGREAECLAHYADAAASRQMPLPME